MAFKILLTGGAGFLGGNIIREADPDIEIVSLDINKHEYPGRNISTFELDLTDVSGLSDIIRNIRPDVIIHTAAISNIDFCEANKDIAKKVNIELTGTIADLCREMNIKMIHFSSDSVFDGRKGFYREEEKPIPLHYYGETKIAGEEIVSNELQQWNVIRPSLIVGLPVEGSGNSFLWKMIDTLKKGESVFFSKKEIRSPVDAVTLSRAVLELAESDTNGFFHLSGNTVISRYEMALQICSFLNFDPKMVKPLNPELVTSRAPRPADVSLDNSKAGMQLSFPMKSLAEGLELVFSGNGDISE